ncbi:hypothetical protein LCGC14_0819390 [marine sediment metagenome]|uniref:Uncharacterized protein n=1 Tax=marine sediment metagenome TaxID=412755 RepID=A0A0F9PJA2_9ZZZZ
MEQKQTNIVIRIRILELEDKLLDLIIISNKYENIPVPVFELEMNAILKEIGYLENLIEFNLK